MWRRQMLEEDAAAERARINRTHHQRRTSDRQHNHRMPFLETALGATRPPTNRHHCIRYRNYGALWHQWNMKNSGQGLPRPQNDTAGIQFGLDPQPRSNSTIARPQFELGDILANPPLPASSMAGSVPTTLGPLGREPSNLVNSPPNTPQREIDEDF